MRCTLSMISTVLPDYKSNQKLWNFASEIFLRKDFRNFESKQFFERWLILSENNLLLLFVIPSSFPPDFAKSRTQVFALPNLLVGLGSVVPSSCQHGLPQGLHGSFYGFSLGLICRGLFGHLHRFIGFFHDYPRGVGQFQGAGWSLAGQSHFA